MLVTPPAEKGGATALLLDLLATATRWAADGNVPVDQTAWAFAQDVLAKRPGHARVDEAGNAVVSLMHGFKVPVLVLFGELGTTCACMRAATESFLQSTSFRWLLVPRSPFPTLVSCFPTPSDELQSFLQPNVGGQLDQPGARYIRDVVLKKLLVYAPNSLLWCLTGSDMALVWMAIADMPTNGPLLLSMAPRVRTRADLAGRFCSHAPVNPDVRACQSRIYRIWRVGTGNSLLQQQVLGQNCHSLTGVGLQA